MNKHGLLLSLLVVGMILNASASIYFANSLGEKLDRISVENSKSSQPEAALEHGALYNGLDTADLHTALHQLSEKVDGLARRMEQTSQSALPAGTPPTQTPDRDQELADIQGKEFARTIVSSGFLRKEGMAELRSHTSKMSAEARDAAMSEVFTAINEQRLDVEPGAMF